MLYLIIMVAITGLTGFTGTGLSLGRTKLFYNNFELEPEYTEDVPEYMPTDRRRKEPVVLDMNKDVVSQAPLVSNQPVDTNYIDTAPPTTLVSPDDFDKSFGGLSQDEFSVVNTPEVKESMGKFNNMFNSTQVDVYEELSDDDIDPDFSWGFEDLDGDGYDTGELINKISEDGIGHVFSQSK